MRLQQQMFRNYYKVQKVINSCNNVMQLGVSFKVILNFDKIYKRRDLYESLMSSYRFVLGYVINKPPASE